MWRSSEKEDARTLHTIHICCWVLDRMRGGRSLMANALRQTLFYIQICTIFFCVYIFVESSKYKHICERSWCLHRSVFVSDIRECPDNWVARLLVLDQCRMLYPMKTHIYIYKYVAGKGHYISKFKHTPVRPNKPHMKTRALYRFAMQHICILNANNFGLQFVFVVVAVVVLL